MFRLTACILTACGVAVLTSLHHVFDDKTHCDVNESSQCSLLTKNDEDVSRVEDLPDLTHSSSAQVTAKSSKDDEAEIKLKDKNKITWALVVSEGGCGLGLYPEIKQFISKDLRHYRRVHFHQEQYAPHIIAFLNDDNEVLEEVNLKPLTREQCNQLLEDRGFVKRSTQEEL